MAEIIDINQTKSEEKVTLFILAYFVISIDPSLFERSLLVIEVFVDVIDIRL